MKTSSAKAKGRRACSELKDALMKYAPSLEEGDIEVTSSGATGEDLKLSPAARREYPYVIEVKNQEGINIWASLRQAESHSKDAARIPLLAFKRNNTEMYVALKLEHFLCLTTKK